MHTWIAMHLNLREISSKILSTGENESKRFCTATWQITPSGTAGKPEKVLPTYWYRKALYYIVHQNLTLFIPESEPKYVFRNLSPQI